jgi:glycosyltransferase involved in cell wall biosynthesis
MGNFVEDQVEIPVIKYLGKFNQADIAIFYNFRPPPYGGGNQFLAALWKELELRGFRLENNRISHSTRVCLFNSHHFNQRRLERLRRSNCKMVHRVDGPISIYRGHDDGTDQSIWEINQEFADFTIFQSHYSLNQHLQLGLAFKEPHIIHNAADPSIFHSRGRLAFDRNRKIRLISVSWSDNPNKGGWVYKYLEDHLDWSRYDYTHVGRTAVPLSRAETVKPVGSNLLADILRQHDIFITASLHEACSNSLIEAMSCGLPPLFIESGSNAEIAGEAGLGFTDPSQLLERLERIADEYNTFQACLAPPTFRNVTNEYIEVMGLAV